MVDADRWLSRVTRGRVVALGMAPSLLLTTTGRRSGQPRSSPLQYVSDGSDYIVIASNWGGEKDPAWSFNLRAEPRALVTVGGREVAVTARETEGAERERLWGKIVDQWPGYETYRTRASHRKLRIFRLTPG
ncbi:nitroreductase/quinone reductase family protein [Actinoplanes sp. GCM10030250]|uniref:nitroreductase/quinone reductase family protein n=1 Tax=Actinoplanes sp. GCM10030250 TaxID=3273376 RepID=UPI00361B62AD